MALHKESIIAMVIAVADVSAFVFLKTNKNGSQEHNYENHYEYNNHSYHL